MELDEIEQLVDMIREARISELTVSVGGAKVKLRKSLATAAVAPAPAAPEAEPEPPGDEQPAALGTYITAPMVGIFHSIEGVTGLGTLVKAGQVVGAIESMKLMNDVASEHDGIIAEILVEDGMPVEYGQDLFRLDGVRVEQ